VALKTRFKLYFRQNIVDAPTRELGEEIAKQKDAIRKEHRTARDNVRAAAEVGILLPKREAGNLETSAALEEFARARAALEAEADEEKESI
jgi:hypothetical protein